MYDTDHQSEEHQRRGFLGTEGVLVLQGKQGLSKTQFFQSLVPPKNDWFADGIAIDPSDKDSVAIAVAHWLIELGELDSIFRKADIAALRAWLTKKVDEFRPPYERSTNRYPRRTSVCASVNELEFLPEVGENRRYWVIAVDQMSTLSADVDKQQLWAQAYYMYATGEQFWFSADERKELYLSNNQFARRASIEELLEAHVRDPKAPVPSASVSAIEGIPYEPGPKLVPELLGPVEIYFRLTGRRLESRSGDIGAVRRWLDNNCFTKGANKKYHVAFVDVPPNPS
jgi:hypothetical protein